AAEHELDSDFYQALAAKDFTQAPGAGRLQLLSTEGLAPGSLLAFSRAEDGPVEVVAVESVDHETWSATLASPLTGTYDLQRSFLRGNIVDIAQGDTGPITLGSGDGSTCNLKLPVYNRAPLLHVDRGDGGDPEPAITVLVSSSAGRRGKESVAWSRVADFN